MASTSSEKRIDQVRAGIIGTGFIGPVHIEALRRLGIPVVALCDLPNRVETAAAKHGIRHVFSDYKELLRWPEVDVVHVTVPNRFHCEMALAAIEAGKHCICEKPLAMNTEETASVLLQAAKAKTVFAVNYNIRFYPAVLQLRQAVKQGELGEIIHVNGSYMQDWLFKETDYNWRLLPKEGGKLRAVADIGTHWMDTASFILGARISFGPEVAPFMDYPAGHVEGFPDTFKMLFRSIYTAIAKGRAGAEPLFATASDGHAEVAVCEAILASHQARSWMPVRGSESRL